MSEEEGRLEVGQVVEEVSVIGGQTYWANYLAELKRLTIEEVDFVFFAWEQVKLVKKYCMKVEAMGNTTDDE